MDLSARRPRLVFLLQTSVPASSPATAILNGPPPNPSSQLPYSAPPASTFHSYGIGILAVLGVGFLMMTAICVYARRHGRFSHGRTPNAPESIPSQLAHDLNRVVFESLPIVVFRCGKGMKANDDLSIGDIPTEIAQSPRSDVAQDGPSLVHRYGRSPFRNCVVCLTDFEEGESMRMLPQCDHCFHEHCIQMWLSSRFTCPLCRCSLLPAVPT